MAMAPGFMPRDRGARMGGGTLKDLGKDASVWRLFRFIFRN